MRQDSYRSIWLSDIHLGTRTCRVDLLEDFLQRTRCEILYLLGDIIDVQRLRKNVYWPASHTRILQLILDKRRQGTRRLGRELHGPRRGSPRVLVAARLARRRS
jgi:hypothetical protein